jgi:hypothetical protein
VLSESVSKLKSRRHPFPARALQHGLDVACFERVGEKRTFEHTAIGQIRRFTMVDLPHTDAQVRVTRRAVVALPTESDIRG